MRIITLPLLSICFILFTVNVFGQKNDLKKANQFFKEEKYALAIPHYKKALTVKKNLSIKSKLAFCYKITNQIAEAVGLYEEIVGNERAKTKSYYYYAETLMSSGRYEEAKEWFKKYGAIETDDETVDRLLAACDFSKNVPAYFGYATITPFIQNSAADDNAPVFWDNGIVFTSDRKGKMKFLDTKSGATDRNYLRLYRSELLPDGTFDKPKEYISKINDARKNTGMATFQADGTAMFFTRNGTSLNKKNAFCLQLFEASSTDGHSWKKAELVSFCRQHANYMHPAVSPDGKLLFFVSDKSGGLGGTDIYLSRKQKNRWSKPENLGETINTNGHEGFPFMHQNGKLYFCSKGHLGLGGFDVFVTELDEKGEWTTPINLGAPINSPADDISIFISENEEKGLFTSSREGGDDDIFLLSFIPKAVAISQSNLPVVEEKTEEAIVEAAEVIAPAAVPISLEVFAEEKVPEFKEEEFPEPIMEEREEKEIVFKTNFLELAEAQASEFELQRPYSLPTVKFFDGDYFVTYRIAEELDKVALILKAHPNLSIEVASHTANLGDFEEKIALTQKRATAISDYLQRKGVAADRLMSKGYGGKSPLNKCLMDIDCSVEEHGINDRIEIQILSN